MQCIIFADSAGWSAYIAARVDKGKNVELIDNVCFGRVVYGKCALLESVTNLLWYINVLSQL